MAKFRIGRSLQKEKIVEALGSDLNVGIAAPSSRTETAQSPRFSRVAEGAVIKGELEFAEGIYFAGKLEGSVQAEQGYLELSKVGEIHGDIHCQIINCYGKVFGNIKAHRVVLRNDCKLQGDIVTKDLAIQNGAEIDGYCKMLSEDALGTDFFSMPIENLRKHLKSGKLAK